MTYFSFSTSTPLASLHSQKILFFRTVFQHPIDLTEGRIHKESENQENAHSVSFSAQSSNNESGRLLYDYTMS